MNLDPLSVAIGLISGIVLMIGVGLAWAVLVGRIVAALQGRIEQLEAESEEQQTHKKKHRTMYGF